MLNLYTSGLGLYVINTEGHKALQRSKENESCWYPATKFAPTESILQYRTS